MTADDLVPFFRQLRRDTYAAALLGALVARHGEIKNGDLWWVLANADGFVKFADEHPEGSLSE
jgi:hypothetical protein